MRSERRGMAGTLRTRAILPSGTTGATLGIVIVTVGFAPSPDVPLGHRQPRAHVRGFSFCGCTQSLWLLREFRAAVGVYGAAVL